MVNSKVLLDMLEQIFDGFVLLGLMHIEIVNSYADLSGIDTFAEDCFESRMIKADRFIPHHR